MARYLLSPQAVISLKNIRIYTRDNFGEEQAKLYLQTLRSKMRHLAKNPLDGTERDEIKPGYYSAFVGSHTIFYRKRDTHIDIIDVLHQRMEPNLHI